MATKPERASESTLWPYEEAERVRQRASAYEANRAVIFESGFGPSGLPHLGTMGEVLRPSYVRHAYQSLDPARPCRFRGCESCAPPCART
jgi:lysyl-tRNA synthetase class 1